MQQTSPMQPVRRMLLVLNTKSGTNADDSLLDTIKQRSSAEDFELRIYTMGKDAENAIRKEIDDFQPDVVAAAGGDGTVNLVAGIIAGTEISLCIIPYGSANGMAKELGINRIDTAIKLFSEAEVRRIDLVRINGRICIHLADVGLNARIVKRFEEDTRRGIYTYAKHLFAEMFLLKTYRLRIFCDGEEMRRKVVSITFANASKYGTGAVINPQGILDDGKFELVLVKPFKRVKLLSIAWRMFLGRLDKAEEVEIMRCKSVQVLSDRRTTLQIDGEVIGKVIEIDARVMPGALKVLSPLS